MQFLRIWGCVFTSVKLGASSHTLLWKYLTINNDWCGNKVYLVLHDSTRINGSGSSTENQSCFWGGFRTVFSSSLSTPWTSWTERAVPLITKIPSSEDKRSLSYCHLRESDTITCLYTLYKDWINSFSTSIARLVTDQMCCRSPPSSFKHPFSRPCLLCALIPLS